MANQNPALPARFITSPFTVSNWQRTAPSAGELCRHGALFLLTVLTTFVAGVMLIATEAEYYSPPLSAPSSTLDYVFYVPAYFLLTLVGTVAGASVPLLTQGALFSTTLLAILAAHEAGHYFVCRFYGVEASLPYFIPAPPPFPTGTFGAFIKIRSPVPHRRALFDIAVAGPLAGFVVIIPVAILGVWTSTPASQEMPGLYFNDPLLLRFISAALTVDITSAQMNAFLAAAWFGLLVTSLNLIPVGQLDGGHISYALFGARAHKRLGIAAFAIVCLLAPLGWWWAGVPSNILYAVLLFIMLRLRHPQAMDEQDTLGRVRVLLAVLTLFVLALSFLPFPFTVT